MSVLFVYDHRFMIKDGCAYSNTFSYSILKRYVDVFSKVTVLARSVEVNDVEGTPSSMGEGVEFIFVENISTFTSFFGLRQRIYKRLEYLTGKHDAVIVRLPSELGLMAADVAEKMQKKCLVEVVGCSWGVMWNYGGFKSKIYAPLFYSRVKNRIRKAQYVSYVTEYFLQNRYPASKGVKSMGISDIELPDIDETVLLERVKKIENLKEKIIFGTIGDWSVEYKGIDIAITAFLKITENNKHFEYHLLGPGDPEEYIILANKLGIADKVFFNGALPGGDPVYEWLDSIDIYLQPSLSEGLPRSLIEAMSRGCPAVGSSVGGIPELLDKKMLFSPIQSKQLSEKIETLMNDKQLMIEVATQNFNKAKQYQKSLLDKKRNKFWLNFKEDIVQQ